MSILHLAPPNPMNHGPGLETFIRKNYTKILDCSEAIDFADNSSNSFFAVCLRKRPEANGKDEAG
jgi:hypothetical protein